MDGFIGAGQRPVRVQYTLLFAALIIAVWLLCGDWCHHIRL